MDNKIYIYSIKIIIIIYVVRIFITIVVFMIYLVDSIDIDNLM
jgi:hypothetical protein